MAERMLSNPLSPFFVSDSKRSTVGFDFRDRGQGPRRHCWTWCRELLCSLWVDHKETWVTHYAPCSSNFSTFESQNFSQNIRILPEALLPFASRSCGPAYAATGKESTIGSGDGGWRTNGLIFSAPRSSPAFQLSHSLSQFYDHKTPTSNRSTWGGGYGGEIDPYWRGLVLVCIFLHLWSIGQKVFFYICFSLAFMFNGGSSSAITIHPIDIKKTIASMYYRVAVRLTTLGSVIHLNGHDQWDHGPMFNQAFCRSPELLGSVGWSTACYRACHLIVNMNMQVNSLYGEYRSTPWIDLPDAAYGSMYGLIWWHFTQSWCNLTQGFCLGGSCAGFFFRADPCYIIEWRKNP